MGFTGDYYRCNVCEHIWDYSDLCPFCGKDNQEDLNAKEVRDIACGMFAEQERLKAMLESHDD